MCAQKYMHEYMRIYADMLRCATIRIDVHQQILAHGHPLFTLVGAICRLRLGLKEKLPKPFYCDAFSSVEFLFTWTSPQKHLLRPCL